MDMYNDVNPTLTSLFFFLDVAEGKVPSPDEILGTGDNTSTGEKENHERNCL